MTEPIVFGDENAAVPLRRVEPVVTVDDETPTDCAHWYAAHETRGELVIKRCPYCNGVWAAYRCVGRYLSGARCKIRALPGRDLCITHFHYLGGRDAEQRQPRRGDAPPKSMTLCGAVTKGGGVCNTQVGAPGDRCRWHGAS